MAAARLSFRRPITSLAKAPIGRQLLFMCRTPSAPNMAGKVSEVPNIASEKSKMSTVEFAQFALRNNVAPRSMGSVKTRLRHAASVLTRRSWSANRVRDLWYADTRASKPTWDEIRDLEETTGLRYAREELKQVDTLLGRADALLMGTDPDFHRPFVAALRALFGAPHRTGTGGGTDE